MASSAAGPMWIFTPSLKLPNPLQQQNVSQIVVHSGRLILSASSRALRPEVRRRHWLRISGLGGQPGEPLWIVPRRIQLSVDRTARDLEAPGKASEVSAVPSRIV